MLERLDAINANLKRLMDMIDADTSLRARARANMMWKLTHIMEQVNILRSRYRE